MQKMKNKKIFLQDTRNMSNPTLFGHGPMGTSCGAKGIKIENEETRFVHAFVSLPMRKRIQKARTDAGLSQKELAQKLNVRHQIVQTYENGTAIPTGRLIQSMEQACGVPYGTISGKTRKRKTQKNKKKKKKKSVLKLIKT